MRPATGTETFGRILHEATAALTAVAGDEAQLEAALLLAHAARIDRAHLIARLNDAPSADIVGRFDAYIGRRLAREPLAYITGHREFFGIDVICSSGALIPRPESEMLVEVALAEARRRGASARFADAGTGTGAIAVAIALNCGAHVTAIDASEAALDVARRNIERFDVAGRVDLRRGDLLEGCGQFDVIVANLPYVRADDWESLQPEVRAEPHEALVGGVRGTELIEQLLAQAPEHLAPGGVLAAEIGDEQGDGMLERARTLFPEADVYVMKDLAGLDRVLVVRCGGG